MAVRKTPATGEWWNTRIRSGAWPIWLEIDVPESTFSLPEGWGGASFTYACARCGKPTTRRKKLSGQRGRIYCSAECREQGREHPDRECPQCGATFNPRYAGRAGNAGRKFCSHECYLAHRRNGVVKTCPVCGKEYRLPASMAAKHRVCSTACKTVDTIYRDCARCGKRFRCSKREGWNSRFCSEGCRRPPIIIACRNCGKEFRRKGNDHDRQFCSYACSRLFRGETGLEARVRVALECIGVGFTQEYPFQRWSIDFAIPKHKVAIEADGDYWHKVSADRDAKRDARMTAAGWTVVRLAECDVMRASDVGEFILARVHVATGLELADLTGPAVRGSREARPAFQWKGRSTSRPTKGQMPLWP